MCDTISLNIYIYYNFYLNIFLNVIYYYRPQSHEIMQKACWFFAQETCIIIIINAENNTILGTMTQFFQCFINKMFKISKRKVMLQDTLNFFFYKKPKISDILRRINLDAVIMDSPFFCMLVIPFDFNLVDKSFSNNK